MKSCFYNALLYFSENDRDPSMPELEYEVDIDGKLRFLLYASGLLQYKYQCKFLSSILQCVFL